MLDAVVALKPELDPKIVIYFGPVLMSKKGKKEVTTASFWMI